MSLDEGLGDGEADTGAARHAGRDGSSALAVGDGRPACGLGWRRRAGEAEDAAALPLPDPGPWSLTVTSTKAGRLSPAAAAGTAHTSTGVPTGA